MRKGFSSRRPLATGLLAIALGLTSATLSSVAVAQPKAPPAGHGAAGNPAGAAGAKPDDKRVEEKKPEDRAARPEERKPDEAAADAAKSEEDTDRAVYLSGDIGFTRPDIGGLSDSTGLDKTGANGLLAGVGIGYRMKAFRFGGRFRDHSTTEFSLWALMAEVGYALHLRPVTPVFYARVGYVFDAGVERGAFASKLPTGNVLTPNVDLEGIMVGVEAGVAYWLTKFLRVGPFLGLDMTILSRSRPPTPQSVFPVTEATRNNSLFGDSGSGIGYVLNLGIRVTGDIGF